MKKIFTFLILFSALTGFTRQTDIAGKNFDGCFPEKESQNPDHVASKLQVSMGKSNGYNQFLNNGNLPVYEQNFNDVEEGSLPLDWHRIISEVAPEGSSVGVTGTDTPGIKHAELRHNILEAEIMLITPYLAAFAGNQVRFEAKCDNSENIPYLIMGTMSDPAYVNTFSPIDTINLSDVFQSVILHLPLDKNNGGHMVFKHGGFSGTNNPNTFRSIYIDNFYYEKATYELNLSVKPEEGGSVSDEGSYPVGEEVTISATPRQGYAFVNWTDDDNEGEEVSTDALYTFHMPAADVNYTANFELTDYDVNLTANPEAGGEVTGGGTFNFGAPVTINAAPNNGWEFVNWTNDDDEDAEVSTSPSYTFDMPAADVNYTANFEMIDYELTVDIVGEGSVAIDPDEDFYNIGDVITLTPVPDEGWEFNEWTGDTQFLDGNVLTMPADDVELTANFVIKHYSLILLVSPAIGGTAEDITGDPPYQMGQEVHIEAQPYEGWKFINWSGEYVGNLDNPQSASATLTMPANDVILMANFLEKITMDPLADNDSICRGIEVLLSANASGLNGDLHYSWILDGQEFSNDPEVKVSPLSTTTYHIKVSDGDFSRIDSITVNVHEDFEAPEQREIAMKTINAQPIVLIYPQSGLTYQWYKNQEPLPGATIQYYYPGEGLIVEAGNYKVLVGPLDIPQGYECRVFSKEIDIGEVQSFSFLSEEDLFSVFPNPAKTHINIVVNEQVTGGYYTEVKVQIFNINGQRMISTGLTQWHSTIGIENLQKGLYFIELTVDNMHRQIQRIIVK